jgi:hypothetical protein
MKDLLDVTGVENCVRDHGADPEAKYVAETVHLPQKKGEWVTLHAAVRPVRQRQRLRQTWGDLASAGGGHESTPD